MIRIHQTGLLWPSSTDVPTYIEFSLVERGGVLSQDNKTEVYPLPNSSRSNEPYEHLSQVASNLQQDIKSILCFSYKDVPLVDHVSSSTQVTIIFEGNNHDRKSFPECLNQTELLEAMLRIEGEFDLVIVRHYMEHFNSPALILNALAQKLRPGGSLMIEVPDCSHFIRSNNPLFLWEQHLTYFTPRTLKTWLNKNSFTLLGPLQVYGDSIEPSIVAMVTKVPGLTTNESISDSTLDVEEMISSYSLVWHNVLEPIRGRVILYGAGHNLDRFISFANISRMVNMIVDPNPYKKGKYLASCPIQISNRLPLDISSDDILVLGVHDRDYQRVASNITHEFPDKPKTLSIFRDPLT